MVRMINRVRRPDSKDGFKKVKKKVKKVGGVVGICVFLLNSEGILTNNLREINL